MNFQEIVKEVEEKAEEWREILNYRVKLTDKKLADAIRKDKPDPKCKSRSGITHPGNCIVERLEEIHFHPQLPRELDSLCKDLIEKVTAAIPEKFPSLEYGDDFKLPVLDYICNFVTLIRNSTKVLPLQLRQKQVRPIKLGDFIVRYCEPLPEGTLESRIKVLQRAQKIKLPEVGIWKRGKAKFYDEDIMLKNWSDYQTKIPNPIPLRKISGQK